MFPPVSSPFEGWQQASETNISVNTFRLTAKIAASYRLDLKEIHMSPPQSDDKLSTVKDATSTLAERAFASIFDLILTGRLAPGAVVNEVEIARQLAMSRGPVREAVRRLEGRKLVTREPYQKARVIRFGPTEAKEIFEFREGLETVACRLATTALSDAELEEIGRRLEASRAPGGPKFDLHVEIARRCGNARIAEFLCGDLYDLLKIYRKWSGSAPGRGDEAFAEHWQIVRAMQSRDAMLAESLMRSHIQRAARHVAEML
jgi:DNA-binding GntR family transcriptional regulator